MLCGSEKGLWKTFVDNWPWVVDKLWITRGVIHRGILEASYPQFYPQVLWKTVEKFEI